MELLRSKTNRLLIESHRAAEGLAPENSWEALSAGYSAGADLLEIDVHRAGDGSLVIRNGYTLPDGRWIREMSRSELRGVRIENQGLPFLDEVLDWSADKEVGLALDIKNGFGFDRQIFLDVLSLVEAKQAVKRVILLGWDHEGLRMAKERNSSVTTRLLLRGLPVNLIPMMDQANADGLNLDLDMVTQPLINQLHAVGKFIVIGMTKTLDIPMALRSGADMVQVADPGEARRLLNAAQEN